MIVYIGFSSANLVGIKWHVDCDIHLGPCSHRGSCQGKSGIQALAVIGATAFHPLRLENGDAATRLDSKGNHESAF